MKLKAQILLGYTQVATNSHMREVVREMRRMHSDSGK